MKTLRAVSLALALSCGACVTAADGSQRPDVATIYRWVRRACSAVDAAGAPLGLSQKTGSDRCPR